MESVSPDSIVTSSHPELHIRGNRSRQSPKA